MQIFLDGTVTLQGRLGLNVTAYTGQRGPNPQALRLLGLQLPVRGPIPVELLLRANNYLSNRVIHLRVNGTIRNPSVSIEPLPLLAEEATRFFLTRSKVMGSSLP